MASISVNYNQKILDLSEVLDKLRKTQGTGFTGRSKSKTGLEIMRRWLNSEEGQEQLAAAGYSEDEIERILAAANDTDW